jgi:hypothetical protein
MGQTYSERDMDVKLFMQDEYTGHKNIPLSPISVLSICTCNTDFLNVNYYQHMPWFKFGHAEYL